MRDPQTIVEADTTAAQLRAQAIAPLIMIGGGMLITLAAFVAAFCLLR